MARIYVTGGILGLRLWKLACSAITIALMARTRRQS
jgi:hypothetical protein